MEHEALKSYRYQFISFEIICNYTTKTLLSSYQIVGEESHLSRYFFCGKLKYFVSDKMGLLDSVKYYVKFTFYIAYSTIVPTLFMPYLLMNPKNVLNFL